MKRAHNFKDLTGQKFNRLIVVKEHNKDKRGNVLWKCKCDCGNESIVLGYNLRCNNTKSCGCLLIEKLIERNIMTMGKNHPMFGKKHSEKTIQKMSEIKIGKPRSISTKKKISKSLKNKCFGNNNPNWKGGISCEPYCFEWSSKEFKDFIKERDGNRCLNPDCFGNIHGLVVHHIDYNKKNCEPTNLITLCASCNSRANKDREWHKNWYQAIIYRRIT